MTADEIRSLSDGSVVELGWALQGLAPDEPIVLRLLSANRGKELFRFEVHYFDIPLGVWAAKIQTGVPDIEGRPTDRVVWQEENRK